MVEAKRTGSNDNVSIRPEAGGRIGGIGARDASPSVAGATASRQRIPTMRMLASLVVNGVLRLPAGYRRGMFLDVFV